MENNINEKASSNDEISLKELLGKIKTFYKYLKTKWLTFLVAVIVGGALGLGYYYLQSPKYTAECTFVLEDASNNAGGLMGLASQFGFDMGSLGNSSLFEGDNLLQIIPSKNIVEKVLLTKVDSTTDQTLADVFLDFSKLKKSWAKKPRLANVSFNKVQDANQMSLVQDSVLDVIYKQVIKRYLVVDWVAKKASLITVSVTSKNEKFSKYMTDRLVAEAKNLYINVKAGTAQTNVNRLQSKADSIAILLNNKTYQTASTQILNANPAVQQVLVPAQISTRDQFVLQTIYAEVMKNLEASKMLLSQQMPVIQIIDKPQFPLVDAKKGRMMTTIIGVFLAGFIVLAWLSGKYFLKNLE